VDQLLVQLQPRPVRQEISSNAADFFASGLKGRWREAKDFTEHVALTPDVPLPVVEERPLKVEDVPLRNAMNEVLRQSYIKDCARVVEALEPRPWLKRARMSALSCRRPASSAAKASTPAPTSRLRVT
jgi:hypothetical protein